MIERHPVFVFNSISFKSESRGAYAKFQQLEKGQTMFFILETSFMFIQVFTRNQNKPQAKQGERKIIKKPRYRFKIFLKTAFKKIAKIAPSLIIGISFLTAIIELAKAIIQ